MHRMKSLWPANALAGWLLTSVPGVTWAGLEPIYVPEPILIPCALDAAKIKSAIRSALSRRGWTVTDNGSEAFLARYRKHKAVVVVAIHYQAGAATIRYHSSEALKYTVVEGAARIEDNYNRWVRNIEQDLAIQLSRACA
jgi:hypothetical protein